MSDSKLQKHLFESAKQLKLKELKYDSNPCVRQRLFQSFYSQLVSVLSSVESFNGILLDDYEVHPFEDPNGVPNKARTLPIAVNLRRYPLQDNYSKEGNQWVRWQVSSGSTSTVC